MHQPLNDSPEPDSKTGACPLDEMRAEIGAYLSGSRAYDDNVRRLVDEYLREIESELRANEA